MNDCANDSANDSARMYGSDAIVQMLIDYGIELVAFNPGATVRGIHDSLVHSAAADCPKIITCCHEEIAVAIAHGYAKASGKLMAVLLHSNVGLLHAAMAVFNAWCDRVPMLLLGGVGPLDATQRRPWIDWIHTSQDQGAVVRPYVKWADQPYNQASVPESLHRALKYATTAPMAPVYVGLDASIQETAWVPGAGLGRPRAYGVPSRPQADEQTLAAVATQLVEATHPVIVVDGVGRHAEGPACLEELSALLGVPVLDGGRGYSMATAHPMCVVGDGQAFVQAADFVLALDVLDLFGALGGAAGSEALLVDAATPVVQVTQADALVSMWAADYQKLCPITQQITADTGIFLSALLPAVKQRLGESQIAQCTARRERVAAHTRAARAAWKDIAQHGNATAPLALPSVIDAIWEGIKGEAWVLGNCGSAAHGQWARQLWEMTEPTHFLGGSGGGGLGYGLGASIGAALACKKVGKICLNLQADGDLLFTPSALWTGKKYDVPLLTIVMNNRSYNNTREHSVAIATTRGRTHINADAGSALTEPFVDMPMLAKSFGWDVCPTLHHLDAVTPAVKAAIAKIKNGSGPVLIDIVIK